MAQPQALPRFDGFAVPPPPGLPRRPSGRSLAWTGSAVLHAVAGLVLLFGMPAPAPVVMPVMLLEMTAPEPVAPSPEPVAEPVAEAMAEAAPAPLPVPAEAPPEPPVATETPPMPMAEAPALPEPPPPVPEVAETAPEAVAELPVPPPLPRPPAPQHRPAPPRPAVAQVQPTAPAPAPPAPAARAAAPAAAAPPASYVARLFAALERHKTYPQEARFRRAQGVAMLHFRMRRDGTVIGYRLERSAGDAALDGAVLAMIERASPLPAPPAEVTGDPIELTVPVRFALR
ncbi:energy transducer TonB [Dankookia sp. GCM10030260]|uniref:energy transducer TonB family protein n=1 Tax=Dankookia sp. GCM10030260 TaxID=3273390 RepID=UPI003614488D